jgi:hypothetical protein
VILFLSAGSKELKIAAPDATWYLGLFLLHWNQNLDNLINVFLIFLTSFPEGFMSESRMVQKSVSELFTQHGFVPAFEGSQPILVYRSEHEESICTTIHNLLQLGCASVRLYFSRLNLIGTAFEGDRTRFISYMEELLTHLQNGKEVIVEEFKKDDVNYTLIITYRK